MNLLIKDIADVINISVSNPSESGYDVFVGLEHYDIGEPVITRYGSTQMLTTACKKFQSGDILLARRNVYLRRAGLVEFDGLTSGDSIVIRVKNAIAIEGIDAAAIKRLLPFILNTNAFWDYANTNSDGTMSKRLSPQMLLDYEFDIPELSEQKSLADKLWAAYKLKTAKLKLIAAINEMVKSQFIEMFGKNTPSVKLESIVDLLDDKRKPINDAERSEMKDGPLYPYYGAIGIVDYINQFITDETLLCISEDCGNYGPGEASSYIITGKAWVNNHAHIVRPKEGICDITYLHNYLRVTDLLPFVSGTTRKKLTQKAMLDLDISLPSIEEQQCFVHICEQADKSKFELKKSIEKIDNVMKALMQ